MASRIMIAGACGMLGRDVVGAAERAGHVPVALGRRELDVTDADAVERAVAQQQPDAVVNCAAWTDVDGAESHPRQAAAVNAAGAGNLAQAAAKAGVPLLHVSTDYVFDGSAPLDAQGRPRPYLESDATVPLSVYGRTKLEGERLVLAASSAHLVVRTAWLFGVDGANFVATMLRLAGERDTVQVVDDQTGCPTWTGHLAPALIGLIEREVSGLAHLAGAGEVTWNAFAKEIFRQAEKDCIVEALDSAQMARPAPRPSWSVLGSEREDLLPLPDWRDGLAGYLAARDGIMRA
ncbi:MAG TPA: dTDP-4-dehydrorhamnose reductase [Solirubrobacteraceae bacterium]|jgi:dTDP-4-dehydrorhamnose reductase|nr:dTDP-4-dehydrorhamnose reductase [Solirubrobacteraceae bacterium]